MGNYTFDLTTLNPQRIEDMANACLKTLSPFFGHKTEGPFEEVFHMNMEVTLAVVMLTTSAFRDMDISDKDIHEIMEGVSNFALNQGRAHFVRVT